MELDTTPTHRERERTTALLLPIVTALTRGKWLGGEPRAPRWASLPARAGVRHGTWALFAGCHHAAAPGHHRPK
jgi:hypothetical protein